MKQADVLKIALGLYTVSWNDGTSSLAAIGQCSDGARWLAPVNWVIPSSDRRVWRQVKSIARIVGGR